MAALEWFEEIPELRRRYDSLREEIESARTAAGPHGQQIGSTGGCGGRHDSMAGIDRLIDSDAAREARRLGLVLTYRLAFARRVLYGCDGRGGLARERSATDADILHCHYLRGMRWTDIASEVVRPDTEYPVQWCRRRAERACRYIDSVGMSALAGGD
jgi:hypothetical protein